MRMVLLNPGPVNVSRRVKEAIAGPDICHREEEFSKLLQRVRGKLLHAFAPKGFTVVVLSGSGTASLEAAVIASVEEGRKLLIIENGVYGERIAKIAAVHALPAVGLQYDWTRPPDLAEVEAALKGEPDIQTVALVHHETTTGLLNPVRAIGQLAKAYGKAFLVDSISGLGGEELDLKGDGIDLLVGTANKCLQGLPGVSFVLVRGEEMERIRKIPPRSLYLDLGETWEHQEKGSTPFTPAIPAFYALDEALDELLEEGVAQRIARYRRASAILREGFERLGLAFFLPPRLRSNTITALHLPRAMSYQALHDRLKARGFVIYAGQGHLEAQIFRVANMGALSDEDLFGFLAALEEALRRP